MADLPPEVAKVIRRDTTEAPERRRKIIQALLGVRPAKQADAADELSWHLMGRILSEISFYQAWRQMRPESETAGTGSIEDLPSLYVDHPDAGFLQMAQANSAQSRKAFRNLVDNADADGMEFQQWPLIDFLGRETNSNFRGPMFLQLTIQNRMDDLGHDIVRRIQNEPNSNSVPRAKRLLAISPYHPMARTTLIQFAWDQVRGQAADWERTSRTQSTVLVALGKQYAATNDSACCAAAAQGDRRSVSANRGQRRRAGDRIRSRRKPRCLGEDRRTTGHTPRSAQSRNGSCTTRRQLHGARRVAKGPAACGCRDRVGRVRRTDRRRQLLRSCSKFGTTPRRPIARPRKPIRRCRSNGISSANAPAMATSKKPTSSARNP